MMKRSHAQEFWKRLAFWGFQIGKTKVFLRTVQMADVDEKRGKILSNLAQVIQRQIRTRLSRKQFIALRRATVRVQSLWRGRLALKLEEKFMKEEVAAVKIKTNLRGHLARKGYSNLKFVAVVLQTGLRAEDARNKFRCRKKNKAAGIIQAY